MKRTIRLPRTLWKTATTLALVALTVGTALGSPAVAVEDGEKKAEISQAAIDSGALGGTEEGGSMIPETVTRENWAFKEIAALGEKYEVGSKLGGEQSVAKNELVDKFVAALSIIVQKYDKDGGMAVSRDDMESIRRLIVSLEDELFGKQAYRTIRTTVEQLLVLVELDVPVFKYKVGVNGILRGEGAGEFKLAEMSPAPGSTSGRLLYRVKPYAYWHPNNYLDVHLEGQGYGFTGEGAKDSREFNLYQGFVEAKLPQGDASGKNLVALKAGRQEFNYGSGFILGADSFFDGLTFDAARVRIQPSWQWFNLLTVDLLGGNYAKPFSDGLKGDLLGAYVTYQPDPDSSIEAYAFRDTGAEERFSGEHRDTFGYRSTSSAGMFGMEYEFAYQSGKLFNGATNDNIAAYGGHVDLTGEFPVKVFGNSYDSSVFLSFALGSGDSNFANGNGSGNKEFRNGTQDNSLVGDMGVIGDFSGFDAGDQHASGIQAYTIGWGIDLSKKLNFSATGRKFMAEKVADGISRDLGIETDFTLTYTHNKDYALVVGYDRFFTGNFFRDAGAGNDDIHYGYAMLQFNYDWTKRKR